MYSVSCANALEANWKVRWHALTRCKPRSKSPTRGHWFRSNPFFLGGTIFSLAFAPGATQQSSVGLPSRSVLFASSIVSFAGRYVLFAGLLWYLLGGMFRVGMEGGGSGRSGNCGASAGPVQGKPLDPHWL